MPSLDLLQGTLDLLILQVLRQEPMHGWGISQRILERSNHRLAVNQGSMYPALHRLEDRGWVRAKWGRTENNRRARYYELTAAGAKQLLAETQAWSQFSEAVQCILAFS